MILAHSFSAWVVPESKWLEAVLYLSFSPFGPPGFIFVAGMGFGFSWDKKAHSGASQKQNFMEQMPRSIILLFIAIIYNLVGLIIGWNSLGTPNFISGALGKLWNLWIWHILFTIAVARILCIFTMKLNRTNRLILSFFLMAITPIILGGLNAIRSASVIGETLYWLLFNPIGEDCIMIFFPFFVIGSVLGELISERSYIESFLKLKKMLILGIVCVVIGILLGLDTFTSTSFDNPLGYDPYWAFTTELATNPIFHASGTPMFLVKNTYPWVFYAMGYDILLTLGLYYIIDYKRYKDKSSPYELLGKYSFTIYIVHYLCYVIPLVLNHLTLLIAYPIFLFLMWFLAFLIETKSKGKYSLEYLIGFGAILLVKSMTKKSKSKQKPISKNESENITLNKKE
jgi:hypothetical protein